MRKKTTGIIEAIAVLETIPEGIEKFTEWMVNTGRDKEHRLAWHQIVTLGDRFEENEADKLIVFKAAYGKKEEFSARKINALVGQLEQWIEVVVVEYMFGQSGFRDIILAEYYHKMGDYERRDAALQTALEKAAWHQEFDRRQVVTRVKHHQYFYSEDKNSPESQAILAEYKANATEFCDIFKASIERLTFLRMRGDEIPSHLSQELEHLFVLTPNSILENLQKMALKLLMNPTAKVYNEYREGLLQDLKKLSSEKYYLLTTIINAINIFPHLKKEKMREELFFWYDFAMGQNIFLEEGLISMTRFYNVVLIFNSLGKYRDLEKFVDTHGHLLRIKKERKHSVSLARCHVLLGKGKYRQALQTLDKVKPINYLFTLWKMIIRAKCLYELRENNAYATDEIEKIHATFKRMVYKYYKDKLFNDSAKKGYLNFFKLLTKLNNIKYNKKNLIELLNSFDGLSAEFNWLEQKISKLKN